MLSPSRTCAVTQICYHAARDILPGEEIFVHYGDAYNRDYEVGQPAAMTKEKIKALGGMPCDPVTRMGSFGVPRNAWWPRIRSSFL